MLWCYAEPGEFVDVMPSPINFGTIGHEVMTSLGRRYARIYKGGEAKAEPPLATTEPAAAN